VNGGPQFTYVSLDEARIVLDQLLGEGKRTTTDRVAVPHALFITPPLATAGLTEREARAQGRNIRVSRENVADIIAMPRAYTVEETRGVMKFIVDADTDLILGAALLTIEGQEFINVVTLAMRHGITATELRDSIYTHQLDRSVQRGLRQRGAMGLSRRGPSAPVDEPSEPARWTLSSLSYFDLKKSGACRSVPGRPDVGSATVGE